MRGSRLSSAIEFEADFHCMRLCLKKKEKTTVSPETPFSGDLKLTGILLGRGCEDGSVGKVLVMQIRGH